MTMVIAAGSRACGIWTRMLPIGACSLAAERGSRVRQQVSPTALSESLAELTKVIVRRPVAVLYLPVRQSRHTRAFVAAERLRTLASAPKTSCGEV